MRGRWMFGSEEPGERVVLISEALFRDLIEKSQIATGRPLTIEWGKAHVDAVLWYEPTVWHNDPHPDQLTLAEAAG